MLTKSQDFGQMAASLWLRLTSLFQRSLESGEDVCSSNSFLGRSVWSSTWRKPEVLRGPDPSRETPSGRPLVLIPPFCLCDCLGNNSWGMGGSPDGQGGNRRSFMYSICLYVSSLPSSAPNPPRASSSHRQMPLNNTPPPLSWEPCFPSWPAVKPVSCWFCVITCSRPDGTCQHQLPCCCDGQQPHTCPCASEVWPDPASLPLCPTPHPHPNAVTTLPTCVLNVPPQGDALCSSFRAGRPTEYSQHLASRGSLIKVNHEYGTSRTFSKISMAWGRKRYGRSTVVSCHKGLAVCDPRNS